MARSKKSPPPATAQGDTTVSPESPPDPPPAQHGPTGPARTLYGLAHLRAVQNLSTAVPIDQVCEEAALELTRLRAEQRPHRWIDSDTL